MRTDINIDKQITLFFKNIKKNIKEKVKKAIKLC